MYGLKNHKSKSRSRSRVREKDDAAAYVTNNSAISFAEDDSDYSVPPEENKDQQIISRKTLHNRKSFMVDYSS